MNSFNKNLINSVEIFNGLSIELKSEHYDTKDPLWFVISEAEYESLRIEGDAQALNEPYEEYCEHERECWNEMFLEQNQYPWDISGNTNKLA